LIDPPVSIGEQAMIRSKKLQLARETLALLSTKELEVVQGGAPVRSAFPVKCEPSGVRACP
jgi:hypothetical protein